MVGFINTSERNAPQFYFSGTWYLGEKLLVEEDVLSSNELSLPGWEVATVSH